MKHKDETEQTIHAAVAEWLGAYLDGELSGARRAWVAEHLASCPDCQRDLSELRALSALLHADPAPNPPAPAFRAAALPRRPELAAGSTTGSNGLYNRAFRYTPLALFGLWVFFQALFWVVDALRFGVGYLPGIISGLPQPAGATANLFGDLLPLLGLDPLTLLNLGFTTLLVLIFLAWLAGYWKQQHAALLSLS